MALCLDLSSEASESHVSIRTQTNVPNEGREAFILGGELPSFATTLQTVLD